MDDVATSDETSEAGSANIHSSSGIPPPPPHQPQIHAGGPVGGPDALDLRGLTMPPMHNPMSHGNHSSMHPSFHTHVGNLGIPPPVPPTGVESLHSANPIDKLYLMQDSYFTQM